MAEQMEVTRVLVKAVYGDVETGRITRLELHPVFRLLFVEICEKLNAEII